MGELKYGFINNYFFVAAIFKSNMAAVQNVYCSIAPQRGKSIFSGCTYIFGSRKHMGRFINCFILVILKFKMATNDHIGSNFVNISPARNDSK